MKKGCIVAMTALLIVSSIVMLSPSLDADGTTDGIVLGGLVYDILDDGTAIVMGFDGDIEKIDIPGSITVDGVEYIVTSVNPSAFENCSTAKTVVIGPYVQTIASNPFRFCESLETIEVHPDNEWFTVKDGVLLTIDGKTLVSGIRTAMECIIPDGVERIGIYAFADSSLKSVVIPESVIEIGNYAFKGCSDLITVNVDHVKTISQCSFINCTSLESINLVDTEIIEHGAFAHCEGLTEVIIGPNLKTMTRNPFIGTTSLTEFTLDPENPWFTVVDGVLFSKSLSSIYAFPSGHSTEYTVPEGTSVIRASAFESSIIESITIADSIIAIDNDAFYNCVELVDVDLGSKVQILCADIFAGCESLESIVIPDSVKYLDSGIFSYCTSLSSVELGSGITNIPESMFYDTAITSIFIPANVTYINMDAFGKKLESYDVHPDNTVYADIDGVLFSKDLTTLIDYPNSAGKEYSVPEGVTTIGECAFIKVSVVAVTLPSTLETIRDSAFRSTDLEKITVPEGVTTIGECAFGACDDLITVILPSTLTDLGAGAFDGCTALENTVIPTGIVTMGAGAFNGVCGVEEGVNPAPGSTVGHDFVDNVCTKCGKKKTDLMDMLLLFGAMIAMIIIVVTVVYIVLKRITA